jgi:hypothetical protein
MTDFNHPLDDFVHITRDHTHDLTRWGMMGPEEFKEGNPLKGESHGC